MRHPRLLFGTLLAGLCSAAACNAVTGVGDLSLDGESGGGLSGAGTSTTGPDLSYVDAAGVTITEVALYQGIKIPLMQGGLPGASNVPIVAGRDALVRVFVAPDAAYSGTQVTGRLYLAEGALPIETVATTGAPSTEQDLASTINFKVSGAAIADGMAWRIELKQPPEVSPGGNPGASYPAEGRQPATVQSAGQVLKIALVPIAYGADGSNRLPDTSAGQLEAYRTSFLAMYPVPSVEITLHPEAAWPNQVAANGNGWEQLLDAIANLRNTDNAAPDVYYYGIFAPADSEYSYCAGGCVAGLGMQGGPTDEWSRAAIGLGFPGDSSLETAVHEIGHTHGRGHAPCSQFGQIWGVDGAYPYSQGEIGVWGYDNRNGALYDPAAADMMGYCWPMWLSDYTYVGLFDRIRFVNGAKLVYPADQLDLVYERARLDGEGNLAWLEPMKLRTPPAGEPVPLELASDDDHETATAHYFPYDHLPGGVLLWARPERPHRSIRAVIGGKAAALLRP